MSDKESKDLAAMKQALAALEELYSWMLSNLLLNTADEPQPQLAKARAAIAAFKERIADTEERLLAE